MKKLTAFVLAILSAVASPVQAGTVYTMLETVGPTPKTIVLSVEGLSLRMDDQAESTMIFKGADERVMALDHEEQSYIVLDRKQVAATMEQLNPALEQMRKRLESLPPDQRAMVEKMMGRKIPAQPAAPPQWDVDATGESGQHAGIDCEWHNLSREGALQQRICVADPDDIIGGREALATMRQMAKFIEEVLAPIRAQLPGAIGDNPMANLEKMNGFPIITQRLSNANVESDLRLEGAAEAALDNNTFAPPAGYTERRIGGR
jgi:hypothetical protein